MNILLEASHVTAYRQSQAILQDVSLSIGEHDFITIIGPNGAGKSMLLKCLMGFYTPDEGIIVHKPKLKIGYLPQRFTVDHSIPLTTKRFLMLRKRQSLQSIESISQELDIHPLLNKPLHVLSGGELQRVLLVRALLDKPDLLILDEPAQNLDISSQLTFYKLLERIYEQYPISILMVSHDLHMVMASTKQVICLYHHICCSGEPHAVTQDPDFITLFGNDMARMMAAYNHSHNHNHEGECQHG